MDELAVWNDWFLSVLISLLVLTLVWGTVIVGLLDHDELKKILSVPDDYEVIVVIPIGKPTDEPKKIPSRKLLEHMLFLDKFGNAFI